MTGDGRRAGALAALAARMAAASGPGTTLREDPYPAQVGLRVDPAGRAARRVAGALGATLPVTPNAVARAGSREVLWLGPDEWLVVGEAGDEAAIEDALRAALAGEGACVELSANRTALRLAGPAARDVLASCCALDLHPLAFGPGRCAQTLIAAAPVVLQQTGDEPAFRVLVRPSFAAYAAEWLLDGMEGVALDATPGWPPAS